MSKKSEKCFSDCNYRTDPAGVRVITISPPTRCNSMLNVSPLIDFNNGLQATGSGLVSTLQTFTLTLRCGAAGLAVTACDPTATSPILIYAIAVMARTEPCSIFLSNFLDITCYMSQLYIRFYHKMGICNVSILIKLYFRKMSDIACFHSYLLTLRLKIHLKLCTLPILLTHLLQLEFPNQAALP